MIFLIALGVVGLLVMVWWLMTLSRLFALRAQVNEAVGGLCVQLQQRFDLIPDSLTAAREGVKAEMGYLHRILDVAKELNAPLPPADDSDTPPEMRAFLAPFASGKPFTLGSLPASSAPAELYKTFMKTMASTEKDVSAARRFVESAIGQYNAGIRGFPALFVAVVHGLKPMRNKQLTPELDKKPEYFATA